MIQWNKIEINNNIERGGRGGGNGHQLHHAQIKLNNFQCFNFALWQESKHRENVSCMIEIERKRNR
jgi:hypothetical protein